MHSILYCLHSEWAFLAKLLWLKVHKIVGCNFTAKGLCPSHFDRAKCLLFWSRRALCSSARLLSSLGSAALELGTRDVHCLSPPLRGEARCEGEIGREETAERRGRVSRSPVLTSKCRFPLIHFPPVFPASRGATVTLGWFHRLSVLWRRRFLEMVCWRVTHGSHAKKKKITKH